MGKKETLEALDSFSARDAKKYAPKKQKARSKKPELLVEKDVVKWAKKNGVEIYKTDAAGEYSPKADMYLKDADLIAGHSDYSGDCKQALGCAVYIECKAKDRRCNTSFSQYNFLKNKINRGCFAVVVDSAEKLDFYFYHWLSLRDSFKPVKAQEYLMGILPKSKKVKLRESEEFDL